MAPHARAAAAPPAGTAHATQVRPYLLLGDGLAAQNDLQLRRQGVTHILNLTWEIEDAFPGEFAYLNVKARDNLAQQLGPHFAEIVAFVADAKARPGGKVLVHCSEGVSRSATAVLAWLMHAERLSLGEAFDQLKALRPVTEPNPSFLQQLRRYERDLKIPTRTTRKLTPLDEGGHVTDEPRYLELLRALISQAATAESRELAAEDVQSFVAALAQVWGPQRPAAYQAVATATFHAFGGRLARDEAARGALAQLSRAVVLHGVLSPGEIHSALDELPSTEAWEALDLPLGEKFLSQLRGALAVPRTS